ALDHMMSQGELSITALADETGLRSHLGEACIQTAGTQIDLHLILGLIGLELEFRRKFLQKGALRGAALYADGLAAQALENRLLIIGLDERAVFGQNKSGVLRDIRDAE